MSLRVLDNQFRIKIANADFFKALYKSSVKSTNGKVRFQIFTDKKSEYFDSEVNIYILKALGFWFSRIQKYNRFIYVFGTKELNKNDSHIPICTIDFPISGNNKKTSAVFAQNKQGEVSALYRVHQQEFNLESFKVDFGGKWIPALEIDKNNNFILIGKLSDHEFLKTFKIFLDEMEWINNSDFLTKTLEENLEPSNNDNAESCSVCGKPITTSKSKYDSLIKGIELSGKCIDCVEKIAAVAALEVISDFGINPKNFNKKSLLEKTDDPDIVSSVLDLLQEKGFLREINPDLFIYNENTDSKDFVNKYPIPKSELEKIKCIKCGVEISSENSYKSEGLSELCKDCIRKSYAVKALNHLEEYVAPGVSFSKDDLFKNVDNKTMFLDYIWTLLEFDLLKTDGLSDFYILKPEEDLIKFKEKYGDETRETRIVATSKEKKSMKKVVKECEVCGQVLPISKFHKTSISADGSTEKCKDCSRKFYAAKALSEFKNYLVPEVEFYKEDLLKQAGNRTQFLDYFWTLQEFNFIDHNDKSDTYILKSEKEINSFIQQYGEQFKETTPEQQLKEKELIKAVKKCKTCEQTLPISEFYKSSEAKDRLAENCKKCSDKINAANVLSEIKKYIGIGNPFSKDELSKQMGNPTKVNYYIWTLQERDLITHNEKMDTYVVEDSSNYKDYEALFDQLNSPKTPTISVDSDKNLITKDIGEDPSEKEIIYISEDQGVNRVVILRGLTQKDKLYYILGEIKDLITFYLMNMTLNREDKDLIKLIVELEIDNDSYEEALKLLKEKKWKNIK